MTEYVITEASLHQWLVFADRKCIASCSNEVEAEKAMMEHSGAAFDRLNRLFHRRSWRADWTANEARIEMRCIRCSRVY
jgi:hypothetical protein